MRLSVAGVSWHGLQHQQGYNTLRSTYIEGMHSYACFELET
jgi:hypothetical protein